MPRIGLVCVDQSVVVLSSGIPGTLVIDLHALSTEQFCSIKDAAGPILLNPGPGCYGSSTEVDK